LSGDFYLIAVADIDDDVTNETGVAGFIDGAGIDVPKDNIYVSDTAVVNIQQLPDLSVTAVNIDGQPSDNVLFTGFSVDYVLHNIGLGDAQGLIEVAVILSSDTIYDAGDVVVQKYPIFNGSIAAGDSSQKTYNLLSIPDGLPVGDFRYLGIAIDTANAFSETDEDNNYAFFSNPVYAFGYTTLEDALDLTDSGITYTVTTDYNAPFSSGFPFFGQDEASYDDEDAARSALLADGEKSYFEIEVDVPVGEDAIVSFAWKVSSENDGAGKSDDFILYLDGEEKASISGEQDWTEAFLLLPGRATSYSLRWSYEKDASISSGSDFAWVDQVQVELLEYPDFRPVGVSLTDESGSEVDSGTYRIAQDSISLNYNFENIGKAYAGPASLELEFYLSEDDELDSEDISLTLLTSAPLGMIALDSGASVSGTANLSTTGLAAGHYYLIAAADPQDLVVERDESLSLGDAPEGNNVFISSSRLVTLVDEPDLVVSYVEGDLPNGGLLLLDEALGEISLLVENQGGAAVTASRSIAFVLQDALGLADNSILREFSSSEVLSGAAGTSPDYTFSRTFDAVGESALTGLRYYLLGFVDSQDQIAESDETNNLTELAEESAAYIFADMALWQALSVDLLNPAETPTGFQPSESISLVNDATAPFESDLPFVGVEDSSVDSAAVGRSIVLGDGESAAFSIELDLDANAALVFQWKTDDLSATEGGEDLYGDFEFSLDATPVDSIDSLEVESDWQQEIVQLDAGAHTLTWRFTRDTELPESAFDAFAYVDSIRFLPDLEIELDDASVTDLSGLALAGQILSPKAEFKFEAVVSNRGLGALLDDAEYSIEARLSVDDVWGNLDDYILMINTAAELPILDAYSDSTAINFTTTIPEETPLGDYHLLLRVDTGDEVLEVNEDNNDAVSALQLISIDAITLEDGLDIEAIDDPSDPEDSVGFAAGYFKSVFPLISESNVQQTVDLTWADSPDIEVVDSSPKWFATGGVNGASSDGDAIKTSELEAGTAASLLFRLDEPRLVRFKVQPNTGGSSNYLFFGENGNALRPEGGLVSRISGNSEDWETRYYVAPAEAPIGFTYVQGSTAEAEEFAYVDELIIGEPLEQPDYVIDSLQYDAGEYVLQRDRLFVTITGNNRGIDYAEPLPDDFRVRVWLSSDATKSDDDYEIGVLEEFQELAGGTRFAYQASLILPEDLPEGTYHLIARIDADNAIAEFAVDASATDFADAIIPENDAEAFTANDNNFLISDEDDIFIDRRADLRVVPSEDSVYNELLLAGPAQQSSEDVVDFFIIEPTTEEGPSELLIKFDLINEGLSGVSAAESDDFTVDVYAATSRDEAPNAERLISSFTIENGIAAGTRYTFEETTAIPDNIDAGAFYYINVVVDGSGSIDESDEEDNSTYSTNGIVFVSDVSLEVALNDEEYWPGDAPRYTWDKSFQVPTQTNSTRQAPFFGTTAVFGQDNSDSGVRASAQTGPVPVGGTSWLQQTVSVTDGSEIQVSFMWKVSSQFEVTEDGVFEDILLFSVRYEGDEDFTEIAYISGEQDWAELKLTISTPGTHTLRWSYIENGDGIRGGADAGWIDDYSESSYDFVPSFVSPASAGPYEAGDVLDLPVFVWNLGALTIPDTGIETTVRLARETGDTTNLDWSVENASDVSLHALAYNALLLENLVYLRGHIDELVLPESLSVADLDALMDAAFQQLLASEADEIEPELTEVEIEALLDVIETDGQNWRDYTDTQLALLLGSDQTSAEKASRKRFLPVRTYVGANEISIPNLLSESGDYYLGVWANYTHELSESNLTNNLLYSAAAAVQLEVAYTIPEVLEQAGAGDHNLDLLDASEDWTLGGQGRWYPVGDADEVFDPDAENDTSLRSPSEGMVQDGEASISALVEGPKLIRFSWRGDFGSSTDVASFYVNDVPVTREYNGAGAGSMTLSSEDDGSWVEEQYLLPEGLNEIRWTFSRVDDAQSQGVVYLDNLRFEEVTDRVDLAISSVDYAGGTYALERDALALTVNVLNRGSMPSGFAYNDLDLEVRLGLSQDFDEASQIIGNLAVVDVLDEGQRLIFQGDIDLPVNLEEGSYYLLARVKSLDPDFEEFTYDTGTQLLENNDYASSLQDLSIQHLPQLVVRATDVENEKVFYPKESIRFDWELQNIGLGDIPYGTELTQTIELWSVGADVVDPSLEDAEKILDLGSVTEVTALPGRLTADNTSQSTIAYKQLYRLPSQAELLAALGEVDGGLEDLNAAVISSLAALEEYQFFLVLIRDQSIDQSSDLNVTAMMSESFRVSAFPYDTGLDASSDVDASLDYVLWDSFQDGRIPWGAIAPSSESLDTLGGGAYEQLYYYAFNLPLLTNLSTASPDLSRVDNVTSYNQTRTVVDSGTSYRAITFDIVRGASDLVYRVQRDNGSGWETWIDIQPPYLDTLYGLSAGYVGSRTLSDVNASDGIDSLLELDEVIVSAVDNNYTATVTVRADDNSSNMRVVVIPLEEEPLEQFVIDYFTGNDEYNYQLMEPLQDYDSDGSSNIVELQLGRDPISDADANSTSALENFVAEAFAVDYGLFDPIPADLAPEDDYDGDGMSNLAELQLGSDPTDISDIATTDASDSALAEAFAAEGILVGESYDGTIVEVADLAADADFDGDGESNLYEWALGGDMMADGAQVPALQTQMVGTDFIVTYVRLIASEQPSNLDISVECALLLTGPWSDVSSVGSSEGLNLDQSGLPSAQYERIDLTIDTTSIDCPFFRVSVTQVP
ncbi:MAG TPA: hypothetical protein DEA90_00530, partial [Opitutae bacterium]|nr:hypothetical protein [Opitutae bacterium]